MKTLQNYIVNGAIYRQDTQTPVVVGNLVKLFLDTEAVPSFPEFVFGVIQHPIVKVNCDTATSYNIEYDENELGGDVEFLRVSDVIDVQYATSGLGTVESVGLTMPNIFTVSGSPVTTAGTLAVTLNSQNQKLFLGSPNNASGVPTFRTIQGSDISNLQITHVTNLETTINNIEGDITNIENFLEALVPLEHQWKVVDGGPGASPGDIEWNMAGGVFRSNGVTITVGDTVLEGGAGFIVLAITRDAGSREPTGVVASLEASVPVSTATTQYMLVAQVTPGSPPKQHLFGEINVHEMLITDNSEFKLAPFLLASRNIYDLPA